MKFKKGVFYDLPGAIKIMKVAEDIYDDFGKELVVTSLMDGKHKKNSKHYEGKAVDLRTYYFSDTEKELVAEILQEELGLDYDVVLEDTHIHVELDPE